LIDFIVDLPSSNGFTNIIVIVDRLTKMRYIVPINSINAVLVAEYFIKYIFKLHRLLNSIVSDCGSQFVLDFWQALYKQLDI
jgi:IS30 family transposase